MLIQISHVYNTNTEACEGKLVHGLYAVDPILRCILNVLPLTFIIEVTVHIAFRKRPWQTEGCQVRELISNGRIRNHEIQIRRPLYLSDHHRSGSNL